MQKTQTNLHLTMHPDNQRKFPLLADLYQESDVSNPDNYFSICAEAMLLPGDEAQFVTWESELTLLDSDSRATFIKKAKGLVSVRDKSGRDWHQLVEIFNEIKGYELAKNLGYERVRFISGRSLPDIEASGAVGTGLIEVKTINESAYEVSVRGKKVQKGEFGLPDRLRTALSERYEKARSQIFNHPASSDARKICLFVIALDLRTVLKTKNEECLNLFLAQLESDVEIHSISGPWPVERTLEENAC
jgi:hypothetical protein